MHKKLIRWVITSLTLLTLCVSGAATAQSSSSSSSSSNPFTPPVNYTLCAEGGQACSFSGVRTVLFRACFETLCRDVSKVVTNSIMCTPEAFGITSSNTSAKCFAGPPPPPPPCPFPQYPTCYPPTPAPMTQLITASSQSGNSRAGTMAFDGNMASRWEASNSSAGAWLQVHYSDYIQTGSITISEFGSRIKGFRVEYLSSAGVWTLLAQGSSIGASYVVAMPFPTITRDLRIMTTKPSNGQPSIAEFRVNYSRLSPP